MHNLYLIIQILHIYCYFCTLYSVQTCRYRVSSRPLLHPELKNEFSRLPATYDNHTKYLYYKLIDKFGTHYITKVNEINFHRLWNSHAYCLLLACRKESLVHLRFRVVQFFSRMNISMVLLTGNAVAVCRLTVGGEVHSVTSIKQCQASLRVWAWMRWRHVWMWKLLSVWKL